MGNWGITLLTGAFHLQLVGARLVDLTSNGLSPKKISTRACGCWISTQRFLKWAETETKTVRTPKNPSLDPMEGWMNLYSLEVGFSK